MGTTARRRTGGADDDGAGTLWTATPPLWLRSLPVALLAALVLAQGVTPNQVELGAYYAAVAPLAALAYGAPGTAITGVAVLGIMLLPRVGAGSLIAEEFGAVAVIAALSVVIAGVRQHFRGRLEVAGSVAEAAQLAVLTPVADRVGELRCAALYRAAQRGALVGGDLYDVRPGPYGVRALVADVQGHGLAAVGTVAALLGAFREAVLDQPDLQGVAARLERRLTLDAVAGAGAGAGSELFATAFLMEFPADGSHVRILSQGHPPALLLRGRTVLEMRCEPGPPLGTGLPGLPAANPTTVPLRPGDVILAYTDGVTEARDSSGTFYPLDDRLTALLAEGSDASPRAVVDAVWGDLQRRTGAMDDDVALLALAVPGAAATRSGDRAGPRRPDPGTRS
ncbi:PP2C family protein-serine/threonine phosphatase [Streptomyces sp. WMMC940]|uniref:PP2C family protein-serine/threonine phosphatase n=1 Tax=Streptomyces sp. WMMC940 TaxID=3015153 RepID=UPI0022B6EF05|nr:PP2C family protein-serine/threonine phosphatase [Streptomyces sp. WMMC940]MCZ7456630.1 PP2C family protein-serine/threonine phosphatase [Streptomyces sp. WMMC940]